MISISGYQINEKVYESKQTIIYRGIRKEDGKHVILKTPIAIYPSPEELAHLKKEYALTRSMNIEGVIDVYDLIKFQNQMAIVLEDFGQTLRESKVITKCDLREKLEIGIRVSDTLNHIHKKGIIHKDINFYNILIDPETLRTKIIDFGISVEKSMTGSESYSIAEIEGTLAYMSPEQTGRMNRVLDHRSDLYSLGIVLYELFTGNRPFTAIDPMEIVHAHIAKMPLPLYQLHSDIPLPINDIILKLLSKTAEDRYQSAAGLKADLSYCLSHLTPQNRIEPFELARHDSSGIFNTPQRLFGRDKGLKVLLNAFERISQGGKELLTVTGPAGSGKTVLIAEIYKTILQEKGVTTRVNMINVVFLKEKQDIPYGALITGVKKMVKFILSESDQKIATWKERLLEALGGYGRIIIDVIPEMELLIGPQPEVPPLPAVESRHRFNLVFQKFISVFAQKEHPLVIFLDELNAADVSSLKLLEYLMFSTDIKYLLIISAFRKNVPDKINKDDALNKFIANIKLSGGIHNELFLSHLERDAIKSIILATMDVDVQSIDALTALCEQKTQGNPFFLIQFLTSIYEKRLLWFDADFAIWKWNREKVKKLQMTDNVGQLMVEQLRNLSDQTQNLLICAACIGTDFHINTLAAISNRSLYQIGIGLTEAVQKSFVVPSQNEKIVIEDSGEFIDATYQFSHDRILTAAYSMIDEERRQSFHLQIGQWMYSQSDAQYRSDKLFDIVTHLNLGRKSIDTNSFRKELAHLNLEAGIKAKYSAAFEAACTFFTAGTELLGEDCFEKDYPLAIQLYAEMAEGAFLIGNYDKMDHCIELVLDQAKDTLDTIKVYEVRIQAFIARNQPKEAIASAYEILKKLRIKLPKHHTKVAVIMAYLRTKKLIARKSIENLSHNAPMENPHKKAAYLILSHISSAAYFVSKELMAINVLKRVSITVKYGSTPLAHLAYSGYGVILCGVIGDIDTGYRFGQLAMEMLKESDHSEQPAGTLFRCYSFINHWKEPVRKSIDPLMETYRAGLETGDMEFASYGAHMYFMCKFFTGYELHSIEKEMVEFQHSMSHLHQEISAHRFNIILQAVSNLRWNVKEPYTLNGTIYNENEMAVLHEQANDRSTTSLLYLVKTIIAYMFQKYDKAAEFANVAEKYIDGVTATPLLPMIHFFHALTHLAIFKNLSKKQQRQTLKKIEHTQKKLLKWARYAPENMMHRYYLVAAEKAVATGDNALAADLFESAITHASQNEYLSEEAIAVERAAMLCLSQQRMDTGYFYYYKAHHRYQIWGNTTKTKDIETKYPSLFKDGIARLYLSHQAATQTTRHSSETLSESLDLASIVKAYQVISGEIRLGELLKKMLKIVIENAGAQSGYLLLPQNGDWFIEAGTIDEQEIPTLQSISVINDESGAQPMVPVSIINYVARTHEPVIIEDGTQSERFSSDAYISHYKPRSIIANPVMNKGELRAILYLENNLACGTFSPERIKVLELLTSQAAISLENALLYANLTKAEKRVRNLLITTNEGFLSVDSNGLIQDANPELCSIIGLPKEKILNRNLLEFFDDKNAAILREQNMIIKKKKRSSYEVTLQRSDKKVLHLLIKATSLFEKDKQIGSFAMITDISKRKEAEEEIKKLNTELELRVNERTAKLRESLKILQQTQKQLVQAEKMSALGGLVAGVAHEINTPMGIGVTAASYLSEKANDFLDYFNTGEMKRSDLSKFIQTVDELSATILSNLNRASTLIRSFKQVAVDQSTEEKRRFNLKTYIEEVLFSLRPKYKGTNHHIEVNCPDQLEIETFPGALSQIITNFIMNSLIHGFNNIDAGKISFHVSEAPGKVILTYKDNGKGMDKGTQQKIFDPFFTTDRGQGSTGLGMHIVFNLVTQSLAGQIDCVSHPGKGTAFTITFPV